MWILDRLQKGKVLMFESQSAVHTGLCHCKTCRKGWTLEGIELGDTEEFHSYSDNSDTTELDEDEPTST